LCFKSCARGDTALRRGRIAYEAANLRELLGTPTVAVHGEEDVDDEAGASWWGPNTAIRLGKRWMPIGGACLVVLLRSWIGEVVL
jgi:hypothetical protein